MSRYWSVITLHGRGGLAPLPSYSGRLLKWYPIEYKRDMKKGVYGMYGMYGVPIAFR